MQEVEAICQKIIIINKGIIVADGSTQEIMAQTLVKGQSVFIEFIEEVTHEKLSKIKDLSEIKMLSDFTWLLSSNAHKDIRPDIFKFAVENSLTIITMQQKGRQLEEIFQSLTNQN